MNAYTILIAQSCKVIVVLLMKLPMRVINALLVQNAYPMNSLTVANLSSNCWKQVHNYVHIHTCIT